MKTITRCLGLAMGLTCAVACAETASEIFERLEGRWDVTEEYPASADFPAATGKGRCVFEKELDGRFLVGNYDSKSRDLQMSLEGRVMLTYDNDLRQYRYWWFANLGSPKEFRGQFDSARNALTMHYMDDTGIMMRQTYTFESEHKIVFTMETQDGPDAWVLDLTTTYERSTGGGVKMSQGNPSNSTTKPSTRKPSKPNPIPTTPPPTPRKKPRRRAG